MSPLIVPWTATELPDIQLATRRVTARSSYIGVLAFPSLRQAPPRRRRLPGDATNRRDPPPNMKFE